MSGGLPNPTRSKVIEDSGATFLARVVGHDGVAVLQAGVSSIAAKVFDESNSDTEVFSGTLTVSSVIFDTLQTDARWTRDTDGYNFRHDMDGTVFSTAGHRYRVEYKFTPTSGAAFFVLFEVVAQRITTS